MWTNFWTYFVIYWVGILGAVRIIWIYNLREFDYDREKARNHVEAYPLGAAAVWPILLLAGIGYVVFMAPSLLTKIPTWTERRVKAERRNKARDLAIAQLAVENDMATVEDRELVEAEAKVETEHYKRMYWP